MDSSSSTSGHQDDDYLPAPGDPAFLHSPAGPSSNDYTYPALPLTPTPMGFNQHYPMGIPYTGSPHVQVHPIYNPYNPYGRYNPHGHIHHPLQAHWDREDREQAREWIKESMLKYQTLLGHQNVATPLLTRSLSAPSIAAHSQARGFARLTSINVATRRSTSTSNILAISASPVPECEPTAEEIIDHDSRTRRENERIVEQELTRYLNDGVSDMTERTSDLTREWERNEHTYPLLFRVAMDVLPVQTSAVPCERVFSSSKETCALRRSRLSPALMEALQMLKFSYKQERLNFTDGLIAYEKDYSIEGTVISTAVVQLLEAGKLRELEELLSNEGQAS